MKVCVHRKGATRAFGPGFEVLPEEYRPIGQPVLVPGSMGTASWVWWHPRKHGALIWIHMPWRWAEDESQPGQEINLGEELRSS